jgi:ribonuclease BN (tRNA processing enzyme)
MNTNTKIIVATVALLMATNAAAQRAKPPLADTTIVVTLGTGNPAIDPDRSGPATAIVVNGAAYLVDFGAGVVRRAQAAVLTREIAALAPTNLRVVFATHLHSDHTVGYTDLILTPWVMGRPTALEVHGPKGIKAMTAKLLEAYSVDIDARTSPDAMKLAFPDSYKVNAHEIGPGVVYKDANVTVTAFATRHAVESYGYRFDTPDRSIVISGDTGPSQTTIDACRGCDVLIHEAISPAWLASLPEARRREFERFSGKYHTTTTQLAELARQAKPKLLALYHYSSLTPEGLHAEMRDLYAGHFVITRDLDVY